jgi:hypothetical protein
VFSSALCRPVRYPRSIRLYPNLVCRGPWFVNVTYTGVQHDFHIRWCSCRLTVTRRVPLVKQEMLTLPEHLSSILVFSDVRVAQSLVFCIMFCRSSFVLFLLPIVSSVPRFTASSAHCTVCPSIYSFFCPLYRLSLDLQLLLPIVSSVPRFTASDYLFGICKLFLVTDHKSTILS